jgi:hypothetical protein
VHTRGSWRAVYNCSDLGRMCWVTKCWVTGRSSGCGLTESSGGQVGCASGHKERPKAADDGSFHPGIISFVAKTVV